MVGLKLIKNILKLEKTDLALYPSAANLPHVEEAVAFFTESLQIFLKTTMTGQNTDLKVVLIRHAMMHAARPNLHVWNGSRAPSSFWIFGSRPRLLIDFLHKIGFCPSYNEVQQFAWSYAVIQGTDVPFTPVAFMQYSADNSDHDLCTLDGKNAFHGMGIIVSCTPTLIYLRSPILQTYFTSEEIINASKIDSNPLCK